MKKTAQHFVYISVFICILCLFLIIYFFLRVSFQENTSNKKEDSLNIFSSNLYEKAVTATYPGVAFTENISANNSSIKNAMMTSGIASIFPSIEYEEASSPRLAKEIEVSTPMSSDAPAVTELPSESNIKTSVTPTALSSPSPTPAVSLGNLNILEQELTAMTVEASTEALESYQSLLNEYYIVDSTTSITEEILDPDVLLEKDFHLEPNDGPQILIYHTHGQEEFLDSTVNDPNTSIVGVGEYLTTLLRDVYGYNVIHDCTSYDMVDGELDRNKAYSRALKSLKNTLEKHPTIEVIIDLHRDGIKGSKMTTTINGKETAKIMFFNGLSRTAKSGDISYLNNPYIQDNLAFSLQLQLQAMNYFPDAVRPIYLKGYRYNLHLRPRSLLIEVGSQKNTFQEACNAMEVLAVLLHKVLQ